MEEVLGTCVPSPVSLILGISFASLLFFICLLAFVFLVVVVGFVLFCFSFCIRTKTMPGFPHS